MIPTDPSPIPIAAPDLGPAEEEAILRVLRSGRIVQGPEVEALEAEFAAAHGVADAVAVANGTIALAVALHALGVGRGDEVLVPAFTFAATAGAVLAVGARPVFVDVDEHHLLDLDDAAAAVGPATAAIVPVHLYGLMVDMAAVERLAARHGLAVVEDAAQAHLARRGGRSAGSTGAGAFSLYATKNMTAGEGGIVTTSDPQVARRIRLLRNHGMTTRYEHTVWGLNLRMSDLHAAIGRTQLAKLPQATERRRTNAEQLTRRLPDAMTPPAVPVDARHVYHQYTVTVDPAVRDAVVAGLRRRGVGAEVYYPRPVPDQEAYRRFAGDGYPTARAAARSVLSLPVHPALDLDDLERIAAAAAAALEEVH